MSKPVPIPPPGFDKLSVDEQIDYVQSLSDRIAAAPEQVRVPDWHREALNERRRDYEANPDAEGGRYLRVIYVPDPEPESAFVITAYDLGPKALKALRRRRRRKK